MTSARQAVIEELTRELELAVSGRDDALAARDAALDCAARWGRVAEAFRSEAWGRMVALG
jgi:hypothetical protein